MITATEIPAGLRAQAYLGPHWADWLDRLPALASDLLAEWRLHRTGTELWHGFESLVIPVRDDAGVERILKVAFDGDDEGIHEALGLRLWDGRGAVRLIRADPRRRALVLERVSRRDLTTCSEMAACTAVAELYARIHIAPSPRLPTLRARVGGWLDVLGGLGRDAPVPRRFVEQTLSMGRDLIADDSAPVVLLHGDLHHENVLAAPDRSWVVIDPKPMSGDAHYEPAPMLWNHLGDAPARRGAGDLREVVRRRFHTIVDVAGMDVDRARDWVIVRMIMNAHWAIEDADRMRRGLSADERDWITTCIAVAKAVSD